MAIKDFFCSLTAKLINGTWTMIPPLSLPTMSDTEGSPDVIATDVTDHSTIPPQGANSTTTAAAATEEVISIRNITPMFLSTNKPAVTFSCLFSGDYALGRENQ